MTTTMPAAGSTIRALLAAGLALEHAGHEEDALRAYEAAVIGCGHDGPDGAELGDRADALRRQAAIYRRRQDFANALSLCDRSHALALAAHDATAVAEALNAIALIRIEQGEWAAAAHQLDRALPLTARAPILRGRIEQNFGVIANLKGDYDQARRRYRQSLHAFRRAKDDRGTAVAYHNLGMVSADLRRWRLAAGYFDACLSIADRLDDVPLRAGVLLNRSEVELALAHYDAAMQSADQALAIFTRLGYVPGQVDAQCALGMALRERGDRRAAETYFRSAITLAASVGAVLSEAEAQRELARLYLTDGRNHDALASLTSALSQFQQLGIQAEVCGVSPHIRELETLYLEVVAQWGQAIESPDTFTFGHSPRVAAYAEGIGRAMGLSECDLVTIRVGATLRDVGKVRVPLEILNKPGPLTPEEFEVVKQHPMWGLEILSGVEFPWAIKPIIRWHHERADGSGYPDGLVDNDIPIHAQIVGLADVFDAMTSARCYHDPLPVVTAVGKIYENAHWWQAQVMDAFLRWGSAAIKITPTV